MKTDANLLKLPTDNQNDNCLSNIITALFNVDDALCFIATEETLSIQLNINNSFTFINQERFMGNGVYVNYVLFVKNYKVFTQYIAKLRQSGIWDKLNSPRGKFFVVNNANSTIRLKILKHLWRNDIYRTILFQNDDQGKFYSANPFLDKNIFNVNEDELGSCQNLSRVNFIDYVLFMDKRDFFHSTGYYYLPYTGVPGSKYQGITLSLLDLIKIKININVVYHVSSDAENNEFYVTGRTNLTEQLIYDGILDAFFVSNLYWHYYEVYEITSNAYLEEQYWIIAKPPKKSGADVIVNLFTLQAWMCLITTYIIMSLTFSLLAKIENERCYTTLNSFQVVLAANLGFYTAIYLKSKYLKLLLFITLLYSIIVFNCVNGGLSSALTNPGYERGITNLKEMIDSNVQPFWNMQKIKLLEAHNTTMAKKLRAKSIAYDAVTSPRNRVDFVKKKLNYCTTAYDSYLKLYGTEGIRIIGQEFLIPHDIRFGLKKGHPYVPHFNKIIDLVVESGFVKKWVNDIKNVTWDKTVVNKKVVLTIVHLQAAFNLLLYGLGGAIIIFLLEIGIEWCRKKYYAK